MSRTRASLSLSALLLLFLASSISVGAHAKESILRLATTTSTDNSGLLKQLLPEFEKEFGISVHSIVSGTGRALNHARNVDVDVILVHAKKAEMKLVEEGFGLERREVMYNEFIIVGPKQDPAEIAGSSNLHAAMRKIRESGSVFISRGDDSGTHKKELSLWESAGIAPRGDWYKDVGQGMGKALQIADELDGYTITDKGTWLFMRKRLSLQVQVEGSEDGRNVYSIIAVNPERYEHVNAEAAGQLVKWMKSEKAMRIIADYKIDNETLFYPID